MLDLCIYTLHFYLSAKLDMAISGSKEDEKKTASIRNRTAAKRVSVVELENIGVDGKLERAKSTPDLLDGNSKARKNIIYATPTVPDMKSNVYAVPGVNATSSGSKVPPSPTSVTLRPKSSPPAPPADNGSPKKQAPKPPAMNDSMDSSTSSEIVSINTGKQSPYASAKILVKSTRKSESPYESSFRPGDTAKLTEEPVVKTHQRTTSAGATVIKHTAYDTDKQNVSFADNKVIDHASSFLKKHPNAKLLITAKGQESLRNRTSQMFEPEPDYDSDSAEEKPKSPVKVRDPKRQSVTVISVGEQKQTQAQSQASKRYTVHSSIPSEDKKAGYFIPPRPEGRAPSPPKPQSPQHTKPKAAPAPPQNVVTVKADVNVHSRTIAPPLPVSEPPELPATPPPDFDDTPSPRFAPPPPAPAPPPVGAPPPPPPPPPPSTDELAKTKTTVKADYIGKVAVPQDAIAAAVAKRQERMQNGEQKMGQQKPTTPAPTVDPTQAAIIAAVQRRKQKIENQDESTVLESIESRLQKTKKLQAAKFSIAGSKSAVSKKDNEDKSDNKTNGVSVQSNVKNPVKKTEPTSANKKEEFSFKVEPVKIPKQQTGITEIKPKFAAKTAKPTVNGEANKTNILLSAKMKSQDTIMVKKQALDKSSPTIKNTEIKTEHNKTESEQAKNEKNLNGESDFLAMAEKKRQEWLSRKQKSSESKSSTTSTPEKTVAKTIKAPPPVSAKPPSPKAAPMKAPPLTSMNGDFVAPPPPGFRDAGNNNVIQLEIIPPPANFSSDSGMESSHQHSPAFSPDTASLVSSLSTLSSLSGEGRVNGLDDVIAPPPPGFDDNDTSLIPPPPEFGNKTKTFHDKMVVQWLCNDVLDWLDSLSMSQYKKEFQRQCIDGKRLLGLSRNNFIDLGVTQVGHRMIIERETKKADIKQKNMQNNIIASEHL